MALMIDIQLKGLDRGLHSFGSQSSELQMYDYLFNQGNTSILTNVKVASQDLASDKGSDLHDDVTPKSDYSYKLVAVEGKAVDFQTSIRAWLPGRMGGQDFQPEDLSVGIDGRGALFLEIGNSCRILFNPETDLKPLLHSLRVVVEQLERMVK